ncbi:MAG: tRNA pseudouridine(55) synthase TruB [Synechococcus sp. SB0678_bin_12]|nr:tRNA pseudouridine(55) synthase TruB [Cyanobacteria bacterium MAG IRC4_bin_6]MXY18795.1 tRNA pseudouridine(55) synthase TruB [Synechococcus sp. SB0664_bin_36]MYF35828.1 tRNA pseudouridine(55) synthase TruB [Synechococcus sp. SB0678_bin_12]MYI88076.1 tRNA pseudouridine(55) synthase TruB [Synechococcus sp. SB0672_bin_10]
MASPSGFLVLDKPAGCTSHDCVSLLRRCLGLRRIGHGGTLDPGATGVLPMAVGSATRFLPYLNGDKAYEGTITLGLCTSSDDLSGTVLRQRPVPGLNAVDLEQVLARFRGAIRQRPPAVSAVRVKGERLYKKARQGQAVTAPERQVMIHTLELRDWKPPQLTIQVRCSAGTYIRSIARDLGEVLGCGGALASLRRTKALGFGLEQTITIPQLQAHPAPTTLLLDPQQPLLALYPRHQLSPEQHSRWRCGQVLPAPVTLPVGQVITVLNPAGSLAGMAVIRSSGQLQPRLVLDPVG